MKKIDCLLCGLMLLAIANSAFAGVFCVDTAEELQAALTTASSNGQDDEVQIVQGSYLGNFIYSSIQGNNIYLFGGYKSSCVDRIVDPNNTILDGNHQFLVLALSAPNVSANFFVEGLTLRNGQREGNGGGIYAVNNGSINLFNSNIHGNSVTGFFDNGGGVYFESQNANIYGNTINDNSAPSDAGGIYVRANSINAIGNKIIRNHAGGFEAGGIYAIGTSMIENNLIDGNQVGFGSGGGGRIEGNTSVKNNIIKNNLSVYEGGGLSISGSNSYLANNLIINNKANYYVFSTDTPGGGVYYNGGNAKIINNTFYGNDAAYGAGLTIAGGGEFLLFNNIILGNLNGDLYVDNGYNDNFIIDLAISAFNNDLTFLAKNPIQLDFSNLYDIDPQFNNIGSSDFRLNEYSPLIDSGHSSTPDLPEFDIEGNPRIVGERVDIGAYEFNYSTVLNAAVLPYARAVQVNETATAFGSLINSGTSTATDCAISLPDGISAEFTYQTTNANNVLVGSPNTPINIPAGETQSFVFGIKPITPLNSLEIGLVFDCANSYPAITYIGLNTLILTASSDATPDLVAIGATPSNDGIVRLEGPNGAGFFATAAVNIGISGTVSASADDGGKELPVTLQLCETDNAGNWISCGNNLSRSVASDQSVYYTVFVTGTGQPISFDPANKRLFLRFSANGQTVGATNVAVTTD